MVIYFNVVSGLVFRNFVEGFILIKCKLCGTANSPDSSVCTECGAALRMSRRSNSTDSNNEIFSNTKTEGVSRTGEQRELFSSGEKYEKMRKGAVLEKIYKQEQAMGEVTELEEPPEPEEIKPIVINRQSSSDIVNKKKRSSHKKRKPQSDYKIPQRIIEPVDSQLLGHKIKPQTTATPEGDNKKVELTASNPVEDMRKNKNSNKNRNANSQQKQNQSANKKKSESSEPQTKNSKPAAKGKKPQPKKNRSEQPSEYSSAADKPKPKKTNANAENKNPAEKAFPNANNVKKTKQAASAESNPKPQKAETELAAENVQPKKPKTKENVKKQSNSEQPKSGSSAETVKRTSPTEKKPDSNKSKPKSRTFDTPVNDKKTSSKPKAAGSAVAIAAAGASAAAKKDKPKRTTDNQKLKKNTAKEIPQKDTSPKVQPKTSSGKGFTESDINSNRNIAALSYVGILFLIPLARAKDSNFCKVHSRQGTAVFFYSLIISLITLASVMGLRWLVLWELGLSYIIYNILAGAVGIAMLILILVPVFSGAVAAFSGEYSSVPIVGKFVNKKNKK